MYYRTWTEHAIENFQMPEPLTALTRVFSSDALTHR